MTTIVDDRDNEPPFSRIFVVCGKTAHEEQLRDSFAQFGTIEYCKIVREKGSAESKGICYIKYDKASSAALAIESMHGKKILEDLPPLKVFIAEARGSAHARGPAPEPTDPEDIPPRSRLFLVIPKGTSEAELVEKLRAYPDFDHCKIVKDSRGDAKGAAFAKFSKSSSAANALEEMNAQGQIDGVKVKALFAEPRKGRGALGAGGFAEREHDRDRFDRDRRRDRYDRYERDDHRFEGREREWPDMDRRAVMPPQLPAMAMTQLTRSPPPLPNTIPAQNPIAAFTNLSRVLQSGIAGPNLQELAASFQAQLLAAAAATLPQMQAPQPMPMATAGAMSPQRLFVVVHRSVTQEQLAKLFQRFPGMEYCDLKKDKRTSESKGFAYINYSTPQAAAMAKDYFDGYEYMPGHRLKIMFAEPLGVNAAAPKHMDPARPDSTSVNAIRDSFAQMMSGQGLIAPNFASSLPSLPANPYSPPPFPPRSDQAYTRPTPAVVAGSASAGFAAGGEAESRLFVVLSKALPEQYLQEVLAPYGTLEYVRLMRDRNCGYAKYTTAAAAKAAIDQLSGTEVYGVRVKLLVADPPPTKDSRKRQRDDE
eukprot:CAMPEP_0196652568 /NCGR_PEP_ID=MMETSP1086-20130531/1911_1 /TAXON_ID=77921 /ORGANISM="Cyanoptyche  gloeocystis , Strain SAG4.97" /LENGTH=592 /DNA_ID=CAMNT_0041983195 /DNA_START=26 /DNA_END=1804 /DNA_ORIENTATION=+